MNDKELADRVVALGVGSKDGYPTYCFENDSFAEQDFVRDWRVVGALMEKMSGIHAYWDDIGWSCKATEMHITGQDTGVGNVDALDRGYHELPRAIIEACVEALS